MFEQIYAKLMNLDMIPKTSSGEFQINCPFHDDDVESLSVNSETGAWKCFGCGKSGSITDFIMQYKGWSRKEVEDYLEKEFPLFGGNIQLKASKGNTKIEPISLDDVKRFQTILNNTTRVLKYLRIKRGLSQETINKFLLGWDGERVTIPVIENGNIVNIRRYLPNAPKGTPKMLNWKKGYGMVRLFNRDIIKLYETIYICEGEFDAMVLTQNGFPAVSSTAGADSWSSTFNILFQNKHVVIVYDNDEAGEKGAKKVAEALSPFVKSIKIVTLDELPPKGDVTDYFVKFQKLRKDFQEKVDNTKYYYKISEEINNIYKVHLSEASKKDYYYKHIETDVIVSGKDIAPYFYPKKVHFTCTANKKAKYCAFCPLNGGDTLDYEVPIDSLILELINVNEEKQKRVLKKVVGIPKNCGAFDINIEEVQNIEEVILLPSVDFRTEIEEEHVMRKAYYIGHGLKTNTTYKIRALTIPDPNQQYVTHLIYEAFPSQDSIDSFSITPELYEKLKIFQPEPTETIEEKLSDIYTEFEEYVTHIYERQDLHLAYDLVFHSPLHFYFQNEFIIKGWLETIVLGDTRTGKSEIAQKLIEFYKLGELITAENTSYAGLVGGIQQVGKRNIITWGKIPLNNKRLVIIDEASGLSEDDLGRLSGIRSSGVAEITKIQTNKTSAQTRLIWISNTREGKSLKHYQYGILSLFKLIGRSEDIARFDFAITVASDEVDTTIINKKRNALHKRPQLYTSELAKQLVLWVWSRKAEDVIFLDNAIDAILDYAIKMGQEYTNEIPLVEAANQRIKLARIAAAIAGRLFSTDATGEKLIITKDHVDFAYRFLTQIYSKKSSGYKQYSLRLIKRQKEAERNVEKVIKMLNQYPQLADLFLDISTFTVTDVETYLDIEHNAAKTILSKLRSYKMIKRIYNNQYIKQPIFTETLEKWILENEGILDNTSEFEEIFGGIE